MPQTVPRCLAGFLYHFVASAWGGNRLGRTYWHKLSEPGGAFILECQAKEADMQLFHARPPMAVVMDPNTQEPEEERPEGLAWDPGSVRGADEGRLQGAGPRSPT